jgi:hypothetical protein
MMEALSTKRASGEMPFSRGAWWRWKLGGPLMMLAMIASFVEAASAFIALGHDSLGWTFGLAAAAVGVPFAIWWKVIRNRTLTVESIDEDVLVLLIPSERAAQALGGKIAGAALKLSPAAAKAMHDAAAKTQLAPDRTRCAYHPDTLAAWCCGRCGSFFCPRCAEHPARGGNPVCATCFSAA